MNQDFDDLFGSPSARRIFEENREEIIAFMEAFIKNADAYFEGEMIPTTVDAANEKSTESAILDKHDYPVEKITLPRPVGFLRS